MPNFTVKLPSRPPVSVTAAGYCSPCEAQRLQEQTAAVQRAWQNDNFETATNPTAESAVGLPPPDRANEISWYGVLAFENQPTGDGRFISSGALRWETLPMPLRWAPTDIGEHGGAVVVGLITSLTRTGGSIHATGFIDISTPNGLAAAEGLRSGLLKGVSVDLDDMDMELRVKEEILARLDKEMEEITGIIEAEENGDAPPEEKKAEREVDAQGYVKVAEMAVDDELMVVTDARLRAATLVDVPAFADAYIQLDDPADPAAQSVQNSEPTGSSTTVAIAASAAPTAPPAAWFGDPGLSEPTPITVTAEGRIYGHIAAWGTCHTGFQNSCVTPPFSSTNYAWFRTGVLHTAEGTEVAVGPITMDTGHANTRLAAAPAIAHYDNTGNAVADVASGEDAHGIWISGSIRPHVTDEQVRTLRASPMSGDWRVVGGQLELCAILAVNLPGFPVPRTRALVASGRTATLITGPEAPASPAESPSPATSAARRFARESAALRVRAWVAAVNEEKK